MVSWLDRCESRIKMVRTQWNLPVGAVPPNSLPGRHPSQVLLPAATFIREIREKLLPLFQFRRWWEEPSTSPLDGNESLARLCAAQSTPRAVYRDSRESFPC